MSMELDDAFSEAIMASTQVSILAGHVAQLIDFMVKDRMLSCCCRFYAEPGYTCSYCKLNEIKDRINQIVR